MASKKISPAAKQKLNAKREQRKADRKVAVALKRKGIAFQGVDLRKEFTPSRQRKARKLAPIISGEWVAIPTPPKARSAWNKREKQTGEKDPDILARPKGFFVVQNEPGKIQTFRAGLRVSVQPLDDGHTIERLTVPGGNRFKNVMNFLRGGHADEMKLPDEAFSFFFDDHRSARIFYDAADLFNYLERYIEDWEDDEEGEQPRVYLYRIHPPDDWYRLVRDESEERIKDLNAEMRSAARGERRRIRFAIERQQYKSRSVPRVIHQTSNEKRLNYLRTERERDTRRRQSEATRRERARSQRVRDKEKSTGKARGRPKKEK